MVLLFAIVVEDDGALGLLVNLFVIYCETCDVCDIYVVLVIYMCFWWYICDVGDVCYIYLLFVWMECKKQIKKTVFSHFAECNDHDTRQSDDLGTCFAEGTSHCTRQTNITGLPSAMGQALGKGRLFAECLAGGTRHSSHLCRVSESMALGKEATFAECLTLTLGKATVTVALAVMATFLCRVSD